MSDKIALSWLLLGFACMVSVTSCTVIRDRAEAEIIRACVSAGNEWRVATIPVEGWRRMECRAKAADG